MAKSKSEEWIKPEGLRKLKEWAEKGLSDKEIAQNIGISRSTLNKWKEKYSDISDTLKKGKEIPDENVENALYQSAIGGVHKVKKNFKLKETFYDKQGRKCEKEKLMIAEDEVYIPGNTTAQIFYLKNRLPEKWREKQSLHLEGNVNNPFEGLTTEQLLKLAGDD